MMGYRALAAGLAVIIASALLATATDAQTPRKKRVITRDGYTVISSRDETGRRRTRIVIQKRSYLDGGTEVAPGERKFTDYAYGPTSRIPFSVIDNTPFSHRSPLPGPFDLPGRNNPMQW